MTGAIGVATLLGFADVLPAGPVVENAASGDLVRHPVMLLRGTVEPEAGTLAIQNDKGRSFTGLVEKGKFKALIELKPGKNVLELKTEKSKSPSLLELNFRPMSNRHYVRLIWLTDKDGDTTFAVPDDETPQTYRERMQTAALLMQSFTAERMHELGYGRRTFRLETGSDGNPVVHLVKAPEKAAHYYGIEDTRMWGEIHRFLNETMPDPHAKNMVLMAYTRKDPATGKMMGHTALGGGNLGLFGSASIFSWPESVSGSQAAFMDNRKVDGSRVHDDSVGRGLHWALASTTMGATLHEMGHTFGLPHCKDPRCIMTRGFDRFNRFLTLHDPWQDGRVEEFPADQEAWFAPVSASYLRWSPWFQPDTPPSARSARVELEWDAKKEQLRLRAGAGLRWVGFYEGGDIRGFKEFVDAAPRRMDMPLAEITAANDGMRPTRIVALDETGQTGSVDIPPR